MLQGVRHREDSKSRKGSPGATEHKPLQHCRGRCPAGSEHYNACSGSCSLLQKRTTKSQSHNVMHRAVGCLESAKVQGPDSCSACSSTFVDAGTKDACGNKSTRTGSRAWRSQMDAVAKLLHSVFQHFCRCRHQRCLRQQKWEKRQQGMALADGCRGPDSCSACSSAFVDEGTRDACGNKSTRTGSRAWRLQMQATPIDMLQAAVSTPAAAQS